MSRVLLALVAIVTLAAVCQPAEANGGLALRQRVVTRQRIVQPRVVRQKVVQQQVIAQPYYQQAIVQQVVAQPVYVQPQAIVAKQYIAPQQVVQPYCAPSGGLQLRQQVLTPSCQSFFAP